MTNRTRRRTKRDVGVLRDRAARGNDDRVAVHRRNTANPGATCAHESTRSCTSPGRHSLADPPDYHSAVIPVAAVFVDQTRVTRRGSTPAGTVRFTCAAALSLSPRVVTESVPAVPITSAREAFARSSVSLGVTATALHAGFDAPCSSAGDPTQSSV